jgi:hypothetical protein
MGPSTQEEFMEFRRPTNDEQRLLLELARIARIDNAERWLEGLMVREMQDGGMGSLELNNAGLSSAQAHVVGAIVAHFDARAGEDEHEALNRAETQLVALFPETHTIRVSSVELPEPLPIPRQGLWAYCRWEASRG